MKDRDFLFWIHARLTDVYGDDPLVDYLHKLRAVILAIPENQETPNTCWFNGLDGLNEFLKKEKDQNTVAASVDTIAEKLDEMADISEYWRRNREKGRMPSAIKAAMVMLAGEIMILKEIQQAKENL